MSYCFHAKCYRDKCKNCCYCGEQLIPDVLIPGKKNLEELTGPKPEGKFLVVDQATLDRFIAEGYEIPDWVRIATPVPQQEGNALDKALEMGSALEKHRRTANVRKLHEKKENDD